MAKSIQLTRDEYRLLAEGDVLPDEMRQQISILAKPSDDHYLLTVTLRYAEILSEVLQDRLSSYGYGAAGVLTPLGRMLEPICIKFDEI